MLTKFDRVQCEDLTEYVVETLQFGLKSDNTHIFSALAMEEQKHGLMTMKHRLILSLISNSVAQDI
jgi:hypothetical protein